MIASCEPDAGNIPASDGALTAQDFFLSPVLDTLFRVGTDVDRDDYFTHVASVAFDAAGTLYVLDVDRHRLSAWDRSGQALWAMGRPGDGPEEFRRPRLALVFFGGGVAVYDQGHRAFTVIDGDGQYRRSVRARGPLPGGRAVRVGAGRWVGPDEPWTSSGSTARQTVPQFAFVFTDSTVEADTFFHAWRPPLAEDERPRGYRPRVLLGGLSDGRVALADSIGYRVKILSSNGSVERVLERPISPFPVAEAAMEAERLRQVNRFTERQVSRTLEDIADVFPIRFSDSDVSGLMEEHRADVAAMEFHEEIPVINSLAVDWDDRIWVTRWDEVGRNQGGTDILTPAAEYLGTLRFEDIGSPTALGPDGLMAYLETDEMGVQTVLVVMVVSLGVP